MKIRRVRSQKLFKHEGEGILTPNSSLMKRFAKLILNSVLKEVRRDIAISRGLASKKALLPDSERFVRSFYYEINGKNIEIISDWPTIDQHLEGRGSFPMWWLVQPKRIVNKRRANRNTRVRKAKIMVGKSNTIVRSMPTSDKMWIHPGFQKYNFLERGVRKGREQVIKLISSDKSIAQSLFLDALSV
jgi:hypothetical protein